jgi:RNA polymerase sigma-70 factor (ECF subfamily)
MEDMGLLSLRRSPPAEGTPPAASGGAAVPDFDTLYEDNLKYVWRAARRLGIDPADTDDVVQEVFVIAHRRLPEFEGRAQVKTWLFKILVRVVRHYFRSQRRKPGHHREALNGKIDSLRAHPTHGPAEAAERAEAVRILDRLLGHLGADKREVFVLAEIEQLSSVEIAEVIGANVNTVYSRLRVARQEFERALTRFKTRELGDKP